MSWTIHTADVLAALATFPDGHFDAVLTDPPYGLRFMAKRWDYDVPGVDVWAEVLRVLRPGAHVLAFGGPRTAHRLACAMEDARLELRDTLMWLYGTGMPKSHNFGRALGGGWEGHGTTLKPAYEPIIMAMRPLDGTFAANALAHGVAGLNIAAGRIGYQDAADLAATRARNPGRADLAETDVYNGSRPQQRVNDEGRWPPNVLLDEAAAAALDAQSGISRSPVGPVKGQRRSGGIKGTPAGNHVSNSGHGDAGGASRFFYVAKASQAERGAGNTHPCVKPLALTGYLAGLLLPPARPDGRPRRILVPYSGSGSEMLGALRAGWDEVVGIEREAEYVAIAERRLAAEAPVYAHGTPASMDDPMVAALLLERAPPPRPAIAADAAGQLGLTFGAGA